MAERSASLGAFGPTVATCALVLAMLAGCSDTTFAPPTAKYAFQPGKAGPAEADAFRKSYARFVGRTAPDLLEAHDSPRNTVYCPAAFYQTSIALLNGCDGEAFEAISNLASNTQPDSFSVSQGFGEWLAGVVTDSPVSVSSSIWSVRPYLVKPAFSQDMARYFGVDVLKLGTAGLSAERALKEWLEPAGGEPVAGAVTKLNKDMDLLLLSTCRVKGEWAVPFQSGQTFDGSFGGRGAKATYMSATLKGGLLTRSAAGVGFKLPLKDPRFVLACFAPANGKLGAGSPSISSLLWERGEAEVRLPRFKIETVLELEGAIGRLGSPALLEHANDFMRISTELDFGGISSARQILRFSVDEQGIGTQPTKKAQSGQAAPKNAASIAMDRPFVFELIHVPSGQPVLVGVVTDPAAGD